MRVLLMISNSNMGVRQLYGQVLRQSFPTWGISNMSGFPISPATIVKGFDIVVYELGAADDPRRFKDLEALWNDVKDILDVRFVTHVEGPHREDIVAELEGQGIVCVGAPFSPEAIAATFAMLTPRSHIQRAQGPRLGERLRGLFRRG